MESNEIMVSICCMTYNHEPYISKCIDGFLMQKTNFKYEILIHDDASTDRTAEIIREYEKKYPDIIKPIYQTENQYSKGVKISRQWQYPRACGKYIALCEGDDYWTDPLKLQIQFDFLESNPDFSICVHQVKHHNCKTGENKDFTDQHEDRIYSLGEIIERDNNLFFATNSVMMVKNVGDSMPDAFRANGFGDYQIFIYSAIVGKFYFMSRCMSVYNYLTINSWSERYYSSNSSIIKQKKELIRLLKTVNKYYKYKYNDSFIKAINREEYSLYLCLGNIFKIHKNEYREYYIKDLNNGLNPDKQCIVNRFPKLCSTYFKLKDRFINGKK